MTRLSVLKPDKTSGNYYLKPRPRFASHAQQGASLKMGWHGVPQSLQQCHNTPFQHLLSDILSAHTTRPFAQAMSAIDP